jgi:hypothetical protein
VRLPTGLRQQEPVRESVQQRQARARDNWLRYRERESVRAKGERVQQRGAARDAKEEARTNEREPTDHDLTE